MTYDSVRELFTPKRTIEVLSVLGDHETLNYTEIADRVDTSSDILTDRLHRLKEAGLVERQEHSKRDVRYSITDDGLEVLSKLTEIDELIRISGS